MERAPEDIADLFTRFKTIAVFAEEVGVGYQAARKMRDRGRINPAHWESVISACELRKIPGVNHAWLAARYERGRQAA